MNFNISSLFPLALFLSFIFGHNFSILLLVGDWPLPSSACVCVWTKSIWLKFLSIFDRMNEFDFFFLFSRWNFRLIFEIFLVQNLLNIFGEFIFKRPTHQFAYWFDSTATAIWLRSIPMSIRFVCKMNDFWLWFFVFASSSAEPQPQCRDNRQINMIVMNDNLLKVI